VKALKRFWHWLRNPEYVVVGVPLDRVVLLREQSYEMGIAVGELRGRQALAQEIALEFPPDQAITAEDAVRVKVRQVH
jgi:hypothetical protein